MDESDTANIFSQLLLLISLTLVNAFFASAEMAAVSVTNISKEAYQAVRVLP